MALREPMPFEEERVLFIHELGLALAAWATAEAALFHLVMPCFPEDARAVAGVAYATVVGLNAKLQFADGAMTRALAGRPDAKAEWDAMLEDIRAESQKRNCLAHWQVAPYPTCPTEGQRVALVPWKTQKGQDAFRPPHESVLLSHVVAYRVSFAALAIRLQNYRSRLLGREEPFPKAAEQAGSQPTIRALRLRMHEALGHSHESAREKRLAESAANAAASYDIPVPTDDTDGAQIQSSPGEDS